MRLSLSLCLILWCAFHTLSCSEAGALNSETVANDNASTPNLNTSVTPENKSSLNSRDTVLKNCIKKDGWLVPSPDGRQISDTKKHMMPTRNGKEIEVTEITYSYGYENPWTYSQDVPCKGGGTENLRGKVATPWYTELSVKSKVFMYSIFAKEVRLPPPSNSDPGEERFIYQIQDADGDGVFETLVHDKNTSVPEWVLKS